MSKKTETNNVKTPATESNQEKVKNIITGNELTAVEVATELGFLDGLKAGSFEYEGALRKTRSIARSVCKAYGGDHSKRRGKNAIYTIPVTTR